MKTLTSFVNTVLICSTLILCTAALCLSLRPEYWWLLLAALGVE